MTDVGSDMLEPSASPGADQHGAKGTGSTYDVLIIGGGPAGYNAGIRAGQLGLRAAVIEGAPRLGGTCLNVGCMPAKSLLNASELFEQARTQFASLGIEVSPRLDLRTMMAQKAATVDKLVGGVEHLLRKNGVEWIRGWGRLAGPGRVEVHGSEAPPRIVEARNVLIATGSVPTRLASLPCDHRVVVTSTEALSFGEVPRSLVVVGAGVIGLELGSVWRRLGSEVTVLEHADRILPGSDAETARVLERSLRRQGMRFRLGVQVTGGCLGRDGATVTFEPRDAPGGESIEADRVLVAVGRRPYTDGLGLESVGLTPDARGAVPHDGHFRTAAPGVWVIGDATTGPMLAHKAEDEAITCIELVAGMMNADDHSAIPNVVYTTPEMATVGLTEAEALAAGHVCRIGRFQFKANSRARINHETDGMVKIVADAATDRILGVHMVGPQVGEMIAEARLAITFGSTSEDLARTSHPHPTRSEALRQAAMDVGGWAMQS